MKRRIRVWLLTALLLPALAHARSDALAPPQSLMNAQDDAANDAIVILDEEPGDGDVMMDEAAPVVPKPAQSGIAISNTAEIPAGQVGLESTQVARLPDNLWQNADPEKLAAGFAALKEGIASPALRSLTLRLLAVGADMPDSATQDLLLLRVKALLRLGQPTLAADLLAAVPQGLRSPEYDRELFLLQALTAQNDKATCAEVERQLSEQADAGWQRWMVLCHAIGGETDKAKLGLELLREQNEVSEFYEKLVQAVLNPKTPLTMLPAPLNHEEMAWLAFTGQTALLRAQENPPVSMVAILSPRDAEAAKGWEQLQRKFGLGLKAVPVMQDVAVYRPELRYLQIEPGAGEREYRLAFLAYALRKALGQPVSLEAEAALAAMQYPAPRQQLSPAWRNLLNEALLQDQPGLAVLLIAANLTQDLAQYGADDVALAVKALYELGLPRDAYRLAREAMESAAAEPAPESKAEATPAKTPETPVKPLKKP